MDLGPLKFRCQGVNSLYGAVHSDNGVVWTDGLGIFLTPISVSGDQLENQEHTKLGEFDRGVRWIFWSDNITETLCCLCVVHEKNISIWKVEGQQPKLSFKQIRKVNIQPIPQGCLWNPGRDILCVLCPQQASLYYSHTQNKGSQVLLQLDSREKIRCGCWLTDGSSLVVCAGTSIRVFFWSDIGASITQYATVHWSVTGLTGKISAIVPVSSSRFIYTSELPLDSLCKQSQDVFMLPDSLTANTIEPIREEGNDDVIRPQQKQQTIIDSLLNLPRNKNPVVDWSCVVCVEVDPDCDPRVVSGCKVSGILTPDLLLYQPEESLVVVGSNNQCALQIFIVEGGNSFTKLTDIVLEKDERPKGVAVCPSSTSVGEPQLLVLVGKAEKSDSIFPSSTNTVTMKSFLRLFHSKQGHYDRNPLSHTQSAPSIPLSVASNGQQMSNSDYETITHNVINFDTNICVSEVNLHSRSNGIHRDAAALHRDGGLHRGNGLLKDGGLHSGVNSLHRDGGVLHQNGGLHKDSGSYKDGDVLSDVASLNKDANVKSNISFRNSDLHDKDIKDVSVKTNKHVTIAAGGTENEVPEPPKRPVRKKRSFRNKPPVSSTSSSSSDTSRQGDPAVKMAMEYQSDSPEVSPRENEADLYVNNTTKPVPIKPARESLKRVTNNVNHSDPVTNGNKNTVSVKPGAEEAVKPGTNGVNQPDPLIQGNINRISDTQERLTSETSSVNPTDPVIKYNTNTLSDTPESVKLVLDNEHIKTVAEPSEKHASVTEPVIVNPGVNGSDRMTLSNQFSDSGINLSIQPDVQQNGRRCVVEIGDCTDSGELEVERTDFESHERCFNPVDVGRVYEGDAMNDMVMQEVLSRKKRVKESQERSLSLESLEDIDRILKEQNEKINKLQEHMTELCRRVDESCCVLPSRYQSIEAPEMVHLVFRCKDGFEIKKKFLLDNGRLQLQQVKQAFSLDIVEIDIDGEPCVIGCNIDGYIPMKFTPASVVYISGTPARA